MWSIGKFAIAAGQKKAEARCYGLQLFIVYLHQLTAVRHRARQIR